ncbi:Uncharacterised protein [Candidatus Bilamarchaeum dharawalense]|uniref:Uncharacterized protein n=1 Tax=Candidatus Bilamarchaeum dharawalense TaxID=2885759 RepID=A0A5E4LLH6_9ARCH|nr:Uncharacterised protein [Candidatus Bilamarchaeum dharawalense]
MAQPPGFKKPRKEAEADVTIPRIGERETQRRAEVGFDLALAKLIKEQYSQPPPKSEMDTLRKMVTEITKTGQDVDLNAVLDEYVRDNPDTVIAKYYRATGDPACFHKGNRIEFNLKELHASLREFFKPVRDSVVSDLVALSNPEVRGKSLTLKDIDAELLANFSTKLTQVFSTGKTQLPVEITLKENDLIMLSKLTPPPQSFEFKEGEG